MYKWCSFFLCFLRQKHLWDAVSTIATSYTSKAFPRHSSLHQRYVNMCSFVCVSKPRVLWLSSRVASVCHLRPRYHNQAWILISQAWETVLLNCYSGDKIKHVMDLVFSPEAAATAGSAEELWYHPAVRWSLAALLHRCNSPTHPPA